MILRFNRFRVSIGRGRVLCAVVFRPKPLYPAYSFGVTWGHQAHMDETFTEVHWGHWQRRFYDLRGYWQKRFNDLLAWFPRGKGWLS